MIALLTLTWLTFSGPCEIAQRPRVRVVNHIIIVDWVDV